MCFSKFHLLDNEEKRFYDLLEHAYNNSYVCVLCFLIQFVSCH